MAGLFVGVIVDEQLFPETEWTSALAIPIFVVLGWVAATALVRWLGKRRAGSS